MLGRAGRTSADGRERLDDQLLVDAAQVRGQLFALLVTVNVAVCRSDGRINRPVEVSRIRR